MDNDSKKSEKKSYEAPRIEYLGQLSTLIQGTSGKNRDAYPLKGPHS